MGKKKFKWIAFLTYEEKATKGLQQQIRKKIFFLYEFVPFNATFNENEVTFYSRFWNVFDRICHCVLHELSENALQNTVSIHIKKVEVKTFDIDKFKREVINLNE